MWNRTLTQADFADLEPRRWRLDFLPGFVSGQWDRPILERAAKGESDSPATHWHKVKTDKESLVKRTLRSTSTAAVRRWGTHLFTGRHAKVEGAANFFEDADELLARIATHGSVS